MTNVFTKRALTVHHVCHIILLYLYKGKKANYQSYMYLTVEDVAATL